MKAIRLFYISLSSFLLFTSCGKIETGNVPIYEHSPWEGMIRPKELAKINLNDFGEPPLRYYEDTGGEAERWNRQYMRMYPYYKWKDNEYRYAKKCTKWLEAFYAKLYAGGGNMQKFSEEYAENLDSVLLPTLTAAYEKANGGAAGLDWSLFGFNVKDTAEARLLSISYYKDHWFNVRLVRKDTLTLRVRIEDYKPKVLINGLLNPQKNIIMTPLDRMKIQALVRLYGDLGRCSDAEFTEKYTITFAPEILDTLRYGDRDGYDWDKLKIGKEKFTDIRDEDVTYLGDDWFFIAPLRRKVGFIVLQVKVKGVKFKVTGFKVPDQSL